MSPPASPDHRDGLATLEVARRAGGAGDDDARPGAAEWREAASHPLRSWDGGADPLAAAHGPSTFRLLWDPRALHLRAAVRFAALHLDPARPASEKAHGLWEHDVVELFVSRGAAPTPYAEVEGSPLGQWLDYLIEVPRQRIDRAWRSGAKVFGELYEHRFLVEISLPWAGLGVTPAPGLPLRANVYVAQGPPGARRHLAFAPTGTALPDFHVPARFAHLRLL